jgi:hypothetical protein
MSAFDTGFDTINLHRPTLHPPSVNRAVTHPVTATDSAARTRFSSWS